MHVSLSDLSNGGKGKGSFLNRPVALAAIVDETCMRERLSLAESRAQFHCLALKMAT